ncbi:MAG: hypothetical protein ACRD5B_18360 [Nitrososphaeraceae archaeon]
MKQVTKKITVPLFVLVLTIVSVLAWNNNNGNVLFATDQLTSTPTFSIRGDYTPLNCYKSNNR